MVAATCVFEGTEEEVDQLERRLYFIAEQVYDFSFLFHINSYYFSSKALLAVKKTEDMAID